MISNSARKLAIEFCAFCFENQDELAHLDSYEKRFARFLREKRKQNKKTIDVHVS